MVNTMFRNSMLLTEGWDCPSVDTIVVLRPTKIEVYINKWSAEE